MNDIIQPPARERYLAALKREDASLAFTIAAIRDDQKAGRMSDLEAAENVASVEDIHRRNCALLGACYQKGN